MKNILKHILSLTLFFSITIYVFNPIFFQNKDIKQHDIEQWKYSANESIEFRKNNGEEALWSNSMFSGMPSYLIDVKWSNQIIILIHKIYSFFLPHPVNLFLICLISFYVMLLCFNVRPEIAVFGSLAFTLSSYIIVGFSAGHNSRIGTIAYIPLIVAGVRLCLNDKKYLGFVVTAIALALHLRLNHLQITYYAIIILVFYGLSHLIYYYKKDTISNLSKKIGLLIFAAILALGTFFGQFWTIYEYSKESIRGKSELNEDITGLNKDYAFQYSNGIFEPLTLFFPHILGGSSQEKLDKSSNLGKALRKNNVGISQINSQLRKVPTYWGDQPLTAPYYAGALSLFLLIFGLIILKPREKSWILGLLITGILLSMGSNLSFINNLIFDYLPGYNKFRSVTFIIIIPIFCLSLISSLALEKFLNNKNKYLKQLLNAFFITSGIYLFLFLISFFLSYSGTVDSNFANFPNWYRDALIEDRKNLFVIDILKGSILTLLFVGLSVGLIYNKIHRHIFLIFIVTCIIIDHQLINKNIFNDDKSCELYNDCTYYNKRNLNLSITEADQYILENNTNRKRVYNLQNTFNEAKTSYFHSSIGGYHGAKIRRYQDLIERNINNERNKLVQKLQDNNLDFSDLHIINMLNAGFFKFGDNKNNVVINNFSNGNAWFIKKIIPVKSPLEEINALKNINTKKEAVIDINNFKLKNSTYNYNDEGEINIIESNPKKLKYDVKNSSSSFIVFSEVYYPNSWKVYINGIEAELKRVNYILRGIEIEPGNHSIEMLFDPISYNYGNLIVKISSIILLLLIIIVSIFEIRKYRNANKS